MPYASAQSMTSKKRIAKRLNQRNFGKLQRLGPIPQARECVFNTKTIFNTYVRGPCAGDYLARVERYSPFDFHNSAGCTKKFKWLGDPCCCDYHSKRIKAALRLAFEAAVVLEEDGICSSCSGRALAFRIAYDEQPMVSTSILQPPGCSSYVVETEWTYKPETPRPHFNWMHHQMRELIVKAAKHEREM